MSENAATRKVGIERADEDSSQASYVYVNVKSMHVLTDGARGYGLTRAFVLPDAPIKCE